MFFTVFCVSVVVSYCACPVRVLVRVCFCVYVGGWGGTALALCSIRELQNYH